VTTRTIVVATGNPGKLREIARVLEDMNVRITGLDEYSEIPEPAETGQTFAENAREKAVYYAHATGQWCLADDSGLVVDALDGRPGVHSARYAASDCPADATRDDIDRANNAKLLAELADVPEEQRTARFVCCLAIADSIGVKLEVRGTVEGRIGYQPRGENGFGYDPLFVAAETNCTTAELSPTEKNRISHRGKAVRQFAQKLHALLK
jgi:XTP/dITP diphosphohydrolase